MVSVVGAIGTIAAVAGATLSFAILRRQWMATRESVINEIEMRSRNVRYFCEPITANLLRFVIDEPDGLAYELKRMFLFRSIQGETELVFAIEDLEGNDVSSSKLDFDENRLRGVLGDLLIDASLHDAGGRARFTVTVDTADPDVVDRVGKLIPYHLLNREEDSSVYDYFDDN
jgi:hypothetical protein